MVPFPMTEALPQSNAWPLIWQSRVSREFSPCRQTVPLCSFTRVKSCRPVWPTKVLGQSDRPTLDKEPSGTNAISYDLHMRQSERYLCRRLQSSVRLLAARDQLIFERQRGKPQPPPISNGLKNMTSALPPMFTLVSISTSSFVLLPTN